MKIQEIQDILRLYKRIHKRGMAEFASHSNGERSKIKAFFEAIDEHGSALSDRAVCVKIYGSGSPHSKYHFLKSHCTALLLEQFLGNQIERQIQSAPTRGAYAAQKQYVIATLLRRLGSKKAARTLTAKTLRMCERYQLTSLSIDLLEELRHNAFLEGRTRLVDKYSKQIAERLEEFRQELAIRELDQSFRVHLSKSTIPTQSLRTRLAHIVGQTEAIAMRYPSNHSIQVAHFRIKYMNFQTQGQLVESTIACKSAIEYLATQEDFYSKSRIGEFVIYLLENYLLLKDAGQGAQSIELCETFIDRSSNLWFKYKECHFLFALHTDQIPMASAVYAEVSKHPRYAVQLDHLKERWNIFKLVLDYRNWVLQKTLHPERQLPSLLRYKKYREMLRSYPVYIKDKRGFNVSLLIVNILILLESGRKDEIVEQIEALATYKNKYLRGKEVNQSAVLFKFFRTMVTSNFSYPKILQQSTSYSQLLRSSQKITSEVTEGLQILPCAWVLERVLYLLKKETAK